MRAGGGPLDNPAPRFTTQEPQVRVQKNRGRGNIVACGDGHVSFRYRDAKSGEVARRTVAGADFLWLVLQHVLPKGFRRARNFGFLHPNCKRLIALLQVLLRCTFNRPASARPRPTMRCPCCEAPMLIVRTRIRPACAAAPPPASPALALTM